MTHGYAPESFGGTERYLAGLLPRQRIAGLEVVLLTGSMAQRPVCGVVASDDAGVPVQRLHRDDTFFDHHAKAWHPTAGAQFTAALARIRPDLVHVHHWLRLTADLVERSEAHGVPTVVTLHDAYTTCPRVFRVDREGNPCARPAGVPSCLACVPRYGHEPETELVEGIELFFAQTRSELLRARALIVADPATANLVATECDVPHTRFTVVPMPRVGRGTRATPPYALPPPHEPLRIGYFGRLTRHKGVAVLVEAFARASRAGLPRHAELHVFGPAESREFEAHLRSLAGDAPVFLRGAYDAATLERAALHAAAFPSLAFETFAFVLDEAFELGLPVLVSDRGALTRRAGEAALRLPPGDVAAWQATITALANDPLPLAALAACVPPPGPGWDAHLTALAEVYAGATQLPARDDAPTVSVERRAALVVQQRESALRRIAPLQGPS